MIKVSKPTKEQLAANAKKMKAAAEKLKERINLTNRHEQTN
jgi:hypothetical protein